MFSTWLYTIAFRTAIAKTKLKKFDTVDDTFHIEIATDDTFPQLEEMKSQEQKLYVKKAIDVLPEVESAVISLFYMDECSIQEIVEITKLSESNVKVKLHRASREKNYLILVIATISVNALAQWLQVGTNIGNPSLENHNFDDTLREYIRSVQ
ncbi:MAG: hypothetical protein HRT57_16820 [Crocinitomicaceae bacterium]|nr:hypothetical protein [Crocinitomicaceae bacterium]